MIPVKSANSNPCFAHDCALCCYETEMPLTSKDIARLENLGHASADFVVIDDSGYPLLKNRPATPPDEGHHCVFLVDKKCSVYEHRPDGCRWYPITITPDRRAVRDDECPHRQEFPMPPAAQRLLVKLLNELETDARKRLKTEGGDTRRGKAIGKY